jgi:hypothetical protein
VYYCISVTLVLFPLYLCYIVVSLAISLNISMLYIRSHFVPKIIRITLNSFSKDNIPGPDGWTVEFYLHFLDLVGPDLLELVEDSKLQGKIF